MSLAIIASPVGSTPQAKETRKNAALGCPYMQVCVCVCVCVTVRVEIVSITRDPEYRKAEFQP